jgi:hypothetical protein
MNPEISYWSNAADEALPAKLEVSSRGEAVLTIESNRGNPAVANVGIYQTALNAGLLTPLVAGLRTPEFATIETPLSVLSGEVVRELRIKEENGQEIMKFVSESGAPPKAFLGAEALALNLINIVRQHPVHAIAMKVDQVPGQFNRGEAVRLALAVYNPGSETIQIPHPSGWEDQLVQLELTGLRTDVPLEHLRSHHQRFETMSKDQVKDLQAKDVVAALITLAPGEQVSLTLETELDWPPGQYETQIFLNLPISNWKGEEMIRCEIASKKYETKCTGESKPEDTPSEPSDLDEDEDEEE